MNFIIVVLIITAFFIGFIFGHRETEKTEEKENSRRLRDKRHYNV